MSPSQNMYEKSNLKSLILVLILSKYNTNLLKKLPDSKYSKILS